MAGKKSRNKGKRGEYEILRILKEHGFQAQRIPLSGATEFQKGDILMEDKFLIEVKRKKSGYRKFYEELNGKFAIFLREDRKDWLAVIRLHDLLNLLKEVL